MKLSERIHHLFAPKRGAHSAHGHHCAACEAAHEERAYVGGVDPLLALRVILAAVIFALALLFSKSDVWKVILLLVSALIAGCDVILGAVNSAAKKHIFDENLLMVVAATAAFIIGETYEGAAVLILFQIGELLQSYAVGRARKSVLDSFGACPEEATVIRAGREYVVGVQSVAVGETVLLRPGERVAFDCTVSEGESTLDMASLTGESLPVNVAEGDALLSGAVNLTGRLYAVVNAPASESTAARILNMVQSENGEKGSAERFITRFAKIYTPVVLALAVLAAVLLPLFTALRFAESVHRALVFLVIACPCALIISVPMSYFAGIGGAAKHGVIFKSAAAVDAAADAGAVVFDKTGTLTSGKLRVSSVKSEKIDPQTLLKIAAHAEAYSNHPLARAIVEAYRDTIYIDLIGSFSETPGKGVRVEVDHVPIFVGTAAYLREENISVPEHAFSEDVSVYIGIAGVFAGRILFCDDVKENAAKAVEALESCGCAVSMLSGDSEASVSRIAAQIGIADYHAACLPDDKAQLVQAMREKSAGKSATVFVGEGINDAPAMLASDLGVAMGALGSDAAIEAAEAVILDDEPTKVPGLIRIARGVRKIAVQNIVLALAIKVIVMLLAAFGYARMWMALFADVGAAILTVLNAIRALRIRMS